MKVIMWLSYDQYVAFQYYKALLTLGNVTKSDNVAVPP